MAGVELVAYRQQRIGVADRAVHGYREAPIQLDCPLESSSGDRSSLALGPGELVLGWRRRDEQVEVGWSWADQGGDRVEQVAREKRLVSDDEITAWQLGPPRDWLRGQDQVTVITVCMPSL